MATFSRSWSFFSSASFSISSRCHAEPNQANAFEAGDLFVRQRLGIGWIGDNVILAGVQREGDDFGGTPVLVEREVVHGAIEPAPRLAHVIELCMKSHKCF